MRANILLKLVIGYLINPNVCAVIILENYLPIQILIE